MTAGLVPVHKLDRQVLAPFCTCVRQDQIPRKSLNILVPDQLYQTVTQCQVSELKLRAAYFKVRQEETQDPEWLMSLQVTADAFLLSRNAGEVIFKLPSDSLLNVSQPVSGQLELQVDARLLHDNQCAHMAPAAPSNIWQNQVSQHCHAPVLWAATAILSLAGCVAGATARQAGRQAQIAMCNIRPQCSPHCGAVQ